jgi:hypothetical protein
MGFKNCQPFWEDVMREYNDNKTKYNDIKYQDVSLAPSTHPHLFSPICLFEEVCTGGLSFPHSFLGVQCIDHSCELQATIYRSYLYCLLFYSCCNLGRLLPISKRVSFNCYLELVLILFLICHLGRIRISFFRNFNVYDSYIGFVSCNSCFCDNNERRRRSRPSVHRCI